jgi:hypothetical protein
MKEEYISLIGLLIVLVVYLWLVNWGLSDCCWDCCVTDERIKCRFTIFFFVIPIIMYLAYVGVVLRRID